MEKYLVTAALPYANGPVHIGHIAGAYLPADIYVRFLRLTGQEVVFICGTDEHGVPITLAAEKKGQPPKAYVEDIHTQIKETFRRVGMSFDNFSGTARPVHYAQTTEFFLALDKNGYLEKKGIQQLYCGHCRRFLPDRYVEGTCPLCHKEGARGDQCEACGSDLDQITLIRPVCKICGGTPEQKDTFHWFLKLSKFEPQLKAWLDKKKGAWKENVLNFAQGLLSQGLPDRAITRDMEWGVPVPFPEGAGKVIYVWFDAPIGYISSTIEWATEVKKDPELWKRYWHDPKTRLVHFIGKDNIVFHSIMWPAVLMGVGGFCLPWQIPANEFLNLEGKKVSTSRNYAIWIHEFLDVFSPDMLRYYIATNAPETKDADFSLKEFQAIVNGELADVLGNFVNRTVTFVHRYFNGTVPPLSVPDAETQALLARIPTARADIGTAYAGFQVRKAASLLMGLARDANKYFNDQAPWKSRKDNPDKCATTLHASLHLIRALAVLGSPLLPFTAEKMKALFPAGTDLAWNGLETPLAAGAAVGAPEILFQKIEDAAIAGYADRLGTDG
ncbi:MAG: methionine--tRNA ligase [Fibrobacterota bacterium]